MSFVPTASSRVLPDGHFGDGGAAVPGDPCTLLRGSVDRCIQMPMLGPSRPHTPGPPADIDHRASSRALQCGARARRLGGGATAARSSESPSTPSGPYMWSLKCWDLPDERRSLRRAWGSRPLEGP